MASWPPYSRIAGKLNFEEVTLSPTRKSEEPVEDAIEGIGLWRCELDNQKGCPRRRRSALAAVSSEGIIGSHYCLQGKVDA